MVLTSGRGFLSCLVLPATGAEGGAGAMAQVAGEQLWGRLTGGQG